MCSADKSAAVVENMLSIYPLFSLAPGRCFNFSISAAASCYLHLHLCARVLLTRWWPDGAPFGSLDLVKQGDQFNFSRCKCYLHYHANILAPLWFMLLSLSPVVAWASKRWFSLFKHCTMVCLCRFCLFSLDGHFAYLIDRLDRIMTKR